MAQVTLNKLQLSKIDFIKENQDRQHNHFITELNTILTMIDDYFKNPSSIPPYVNESKFEYQFEYTLLYNRFLQAFKDDLNTNGYYSEFLHLGFAEQGYYASVSSRLPNTKLIVKLKTHLV